MKFILLTAIDGLPVMMRTDTIRHAMWEEIKGLEPRTTLYLTGDEVVRVKETPQHIFALIRNADEL
jgi:hypothetical protein